MKAKYEKPTLELLNFRLNMSIASTCQFLEPKPQTDDITCEYDDIIPGAFAENCDRQIKSYCYTTVRDILFNS